MSSSTIWEPEAPEPTTRTAPDGKLVRIPVLRRMQLHDPARQRRAPGRTPRTLVRSGGENDVGRLEDGVRGVNEEP